MEVHIGVDVGGTNTDAVILHQSKVIGCSKQSTTHDVTTGIKRAISEALKNATITNINTSFKILRVHIGTTHFVNALVQKQGLATVSVIRLCGTASRALPPFSDFPSDLKQVIFGGVYMIDGGYDYDGASEISPLNPQEIINTIEDIKSKGITNVVVSGIFSVVNNTHEEKISSFFQEYYPNASLTLSHCVGQLGLLERENAAILNESLKPLCRQTIFAFRAALDQLGMTCPFYLTQNDGTLISAEQTLRQPIQTFASGPTNSMRGAAFLSDVNDAIVVDIGGTSADVGVLIGGFPREASTKVKVGNVPTNFRMPDVVSIGLGGGSVIKHKQNNGKINVEVGPQSVGFHLMTEGLIFGGNTLTASDIAVKAGFVAMGNPQHVASLSQELVAATVTKMQAMIENVIDQVKINKEEIPVILVGGGSILIDSDHQMKGITKIIKPENFAVANAVGAALGQISGTVDYTVGLNYKTREEAIDEAMENAIQSAIQAGADKDSIKIVDVMEVPLAYLPGNITRIKVKAVGDLKPDSCDSYVTLAEPQNIDVSSREEMDRVIQTHTAMGQSLEKGDCVDAVETSPNINPDTGEWTLTEWDIECIAIGAGILGTGGGGSPNIGRLRARRALKEGKRIRVITPERFDNTPDTRIAIVAVIGAPTITVERLPNGKESVLAIEAVQSLYSKGNYRLSGALENQDRLVSIAGMGAPTIGIERLKSDTESICAVRTMQTISSTDVFQNEGLLEVNDDLEIKSRDGIKYIDDYKPKDNYSDRSSGPQIKVLMSAEIGGSNAMEPLVIGAELDLPVADCDFMGRAFPELQMCTNFIYGIPPYPAILADHNGRQAVVLYAETAKHLENHFRDVCVSMGCAAAFVERPLTKEEVLEKAVLHSMSRAWRLGQSVLHARKEKEPPIEAILKHEGGKLLITGKISDVQRRTTGGFARGELIVEGFNTFVDQCLYIKFQNENLVATTKDEKGISKVLACTPDLISLVDIDTGEPIPTEEVHYGLRVAVLAMPASPQLTTPEALAVVGPQAFGYSKEVTFHPCAEYMEHDPVPPR